MAASSSEEESGSSSGSENEDLARLKEAVNHEFIDKSLFDGDKNNKTGSDGESHAKKKLVSLRRQPEDEEFQNAVHVTPGFQKFVAKKLAKIIDSQIEEKTKRKKEKVKHKSEGGIKLLSTSKTFVSVDSVVLEPRTKRRKASSSEDSEVEMERMSQVAVTSDWVLNNEGTKGWEPRARGDEILVTKTGAVVHKKISRYSKK